MKLQHRLSQADVELNALFADVLRDIQRNAADAARRNPKRDRGT